MSSTKIALVTGGSRGLGKDMALSIAKKGMDVLITYKTNKEEAEQTVKMVRDIGRNADSLELDMSNFGKIDSFIQLVKQSLSSSFKADKFDFLINNAGMGAT